MSDLPDYFFRLRDNGAAVFRVDTTQNMRLEMTEIAAVNARNGTVRPHGQSELTAQDEAAISEWLADRQAELTLREEAIPAACLEQLGKTAHWAQSRATDADLDAVSDALLLAMHDLRGVLVRKRAESMANED